MATDRHGQSSKRRPHRKSRNGCLHCKQRHVKCDERRPACGNCTTTSRECSFLALQPAAHPGSGPGAVTPDPSSSAGTTPASGTWESHTSTHAHSISDGGGESPPTAAPALPALPVSPLLFEIRHLLLVHHFDTVMMKDLLITGATGDDHAAGSISETIFRSATAAPYLLVEALAFSAAHLSTLQTDPAERAETLQTAEELQTRALGLFNQTQACLTEDNCLSMFIFTSFIGMHSLFDALTAAAGLSGFLSKFVQYLRIHRGVRIIAGQSWQFILNTNTYIRRVADGLDRAQETSRAAYDESDRLMELLSRSRETVSESVFTICADAIQTLQAVSKQHRGLPKHMQPHITISWPIRISSEYVGLLEQRQPIALIVLTYWAILLHRDRDFWVFHTAGQSLITSVAEYLGSYWDEWLETPRNSIVAS